jgi:hypothetical protein
MSMETIRAIVLNKSDINGYHRLVLEFLDHYNVHDGSSISEVRVSVVAYDKLATGDMILCPMKMEEEGLTYDYEYPIQKVKKQI